MEFSAVCGVCNERLTWTQSGEKSWGVIKVDDQGCVSVTVQDPSGVVSKHMATHHADGSYVETHKKVIRQQGDRFKSMTERGIL